MQHTTPRRLIVWSLGGLALAIVLGIVGYSVGVSLAVWRGSHVGVEQYVLMSPTEPRGIDRATALLFAWPAVVAAVAAVLHEIRRGRPSIRMLALFLAIPIVAIGLATVAEVMSMKSALASSDNGIQPMLTLETFGPGSAEARVAAFVAAMLWLWVWVRRPASGSSPSGAPES